jgi:metallo-beta-lactamase class B
VKVPLWSPLGVQTCYGCVRGCPFRIGPQPSHGSADFDQVVIVTKSCENGRCLNLVYADRLSPVSADGFRFSRRKEYPNGEDFERSLSYLESTPCDILITPHPDASGLWNRLKQRRASPDALVDSNACLVLAESSREQLKKRLVTERE